MSTKFDPKKLADVQSRMCLKKLAAVRSRLKVKKMPLAVAMEDGTSAPTSGMKKYKIPT